MKIRGNTVGTTLPKPNWEQTDPKKGDYIRNKPEAIGGDGSDFYQNFSRAIADINNGISDNAVTDTSTAKVKVFQGDTGKTTVVLLDDVSESTEIQVSKDIDIVLGGKTLSFTTATACLRFAAGTKCTINGKVAGSKISKDNIGSVTAGTYVLEGGGSSLYIYGGEYSLSGDFGTKVGVVAIARQNSYFEMDGCTVNCTKTNTDESAMTIGVQVQASETIIKNCSITVSSVSKTVGIFFATSGAKAVVENSTVKATGSVNNTNNNVYAIMNFSTLTVENSALLADAPGCHANESVAIGIQNSSELFCKNANVNGTHSGIQSNHNNSKLYVDGGTYTGFCHGGFYIAHKGNGPVYINDAIMRCGNYEGEFDYSGKTGDIYGSMYISGASNISAYLDGCTIGVDGANSIVLSSSSGASNNTLNISNSTIVDGAGIRIDSGTGHLVNVGVGTNITAQSTGTPSQMAFTNGFYRKKHPDAVCGGKDFAALAAFMTAQN